MTRKNKPLQIPSVDERMNFYRSRVESGELDLDKAIELLACMHTAAHSYNGLADWWRKEYYSLIGGKSVRIRQGVFYSILHKLGTFLRDFALEEKYVSEDSIFCDCCAKRIEKSIKKEETNE